MTASTPATPDPRITALENVLYGAVTSSDEEYDAHVAGQAALASLAAELAATRQALHVIAHSQGGKYELLATMREIARAVLAGEDTT